MTDPAPGLYAHHPRTWQDHRYVYPVVSRRSRGLSLGINLNPDKVCNFDCPYCSVDRSVPGGARDVDLAVLERELDAMLAAAASGAIWDFPPFDRAAPHLRRVNDLAMSGDGEPTACPQFAAAARLAADLRDRHLAGRGVRLVLITNATLLQRHEVAATLRELDPRGLEVWAKLDAGSEEWYARIDRSAVPFARILANLLACGRERPLVIQSLFCRLHGEAPGPDEVAAWAGRLAALRDQGCRIERVQVYTTARTTAETWVSPLDQDWLETAAAAARAHGLAAEVFGAAG
jgi:wyosine [tRNA(Phe)-imidazoG37] synthetase (radical SAM superfamily)